MARGDAVGVEAVAVPGELDRGGVLAAPLTDIVAGLGVAFPTLPSPHAELRA